MVDALLFLLQNGKDAAKLTSQSISTNGGLFAALEECENDQSLCVSILFLLMRFNPTFAVPKGSPPRNPSPAQPGVEVANRILNSSEPDLIKAFVDIIGSQGDVDLLFSFEEEHDPNGSYSHLVIASVKEICKGTHAASLLNSNKFLTRWTDIKAMLADDEFNEIIELYIQNYGLCDAIEDRDTYSIDDAPLHVYVLSSNHCPQKFRDWCGKKVRAMDEAAWATTFQNEAGLNVVIRLHTAEMALNLDSDYEKALAKMSADVAGGRTPIESFVAHANVWTSLFTSNEFRRRVQVAALQSACEINGTPPDVFFVCFGELLADEKILKENANTVDKLFVSIVDAEQMPIEGLKWLEDVLKRNSDLLDSFSRGVEPFKNRIRKHLSSDMASEAGEFITRIAAIIGVEAPPSDTEHPNQELEDKE